MPDDPGALVAPDGSPVDIYRHLPHLGEANVIDAAIPPGASVLDLGCGAGRIGGPLVALGHPVTGVDNEPGMLAALPVGIEPVRADVVGLRLGRTFGCVLLASHFLNDDDATALLETVTAHLANGGILVAEVYPTTMDWPGSVGRPRQIGEVEVTVARAMVDGRRLDAEMLYRMGDREWRQPFAAKIRDEAELRGLLSGAGLSWRGWLDERRTWFAAVRP